MNDQPAIYAVKPELIERRCGGWLAITPRGWPLSIGVTAPTLADAKREFAAALDRWSKIQETVAGMSQRKRAAKKPKKTRRVQPPVETGHRRSFDQLLDDAIFGVKKKNPRG